ERLPDVVPPDLGVDDHAVEVEDHRPDRATRHPILAGCPAAQRAALRLAAALAEDRVPGVLAAAGFVPALAAGLGAPDRTVEDRRVAPAFVAPARERRRGVSSIGGRGRPSIAAMTRRAKPAAWSASASTPRRTWPSIWKL